MKKAFSHHLEIYLQIYILIWEWQNKKYGEFFAEKAAFSFVGLPIFGDCMLIESIFSFVTTWMGYDFSNAMSKLRFVLMVIVILYGAIEYRNHHVIMKRYSKIPQDKRKSKLFLCVYSFLNLTLSFIIAGITNKLF